MKYAVVADIHGNLEAFQAVLEDARAQKCTNFCCLGDIVGFGANPKECLDIVRQMNMPCVKGEYDEYSSSEEELDGFNPHAAEAVTWTRKQLTREDRQWLRDLKEVRFAGSFRWWPVSKTSPEGPSDEDEYSGACGRSFSIVHATLHGPQRWGYVFDKLMAAASITYQNTGVCFFGHTHVPVAFVRDTVVRAGSYSKFEVEPGRKYFVNVGSVGQPRDNNPKAAYVIYDLDEGSIEIRRLDYDIPTTQKKILAAGLPPRLADCLAHGKGEPHGTWPKSETEQPESPPAASPPGFWSRVKGWFA